jgi:protein-S-isoprenylcysteine O-methyltransferase Ste14
MTLGNSSFVAVAFPAIPEIDSEAIIKGLWMLFALYWLVSAIKRKETKKRESMLQRLLYMLPLIAAFILVFRAEGHYGWLGQRFLPDAAVVQWVAVVLTESGVAIAFWARWHLGANWSGVVTLKEGHELIRTGPYRFVRHPIYTGMLLMLVGTIVAIGEVRGLIALLMAWASFYVKARREESFLSQEFGPRFAEHSEHTGMFLPRFS